MQRSIAYFACAMFGSFLFALSFIRKDKKSLADVLSSTEIVYDKKTEAAALDTGTEFQLALIEAEAEPEYFKQNKAA